MRPVLLFAVAAGTVFGQNGQIQQPKGHWQKPGEIQQPTGPWLKPGPIQVPKGIQAISERDDKCQHRLIIGSDALFEFNSATLNATAKETLGVLGPVILKAGKHPIIVEGHTDSVGSDAYNQDLSERRAQSVRAWLIEQHYLAAASSETRGDGKTRPAASNTNQDGSDNPAGRQKNRRVEVVIDTCR